MGYHFSPEGLAIAEKTLDNFVERAIRLYEQGPGEPFGSTRLGEYAKRWVRWAGAGLGKIVRERDGILIYEQIFRNMPSEGSPNKFLPRTEEYIPLYPLV